MIVLESNDCRSLTRNRGPRRRTLLMGLYKKCLGVIHEGWVVEMLLVLQDFSITLVLTSDCALSKLGEGGWAEKRGDVNCR